MDSFIQVDKNEWKDFLEELSRFEKKYRLLLNMLDVDETRLQALDTPEKKDVVSEEASRQVSVKSPEKPPAGEVRGSFLSRLKTKLEPPGGSWTRTIARPGPLSKQQPLAACSRCGFQIVQATRFCQHCGADYGKWVCSCGRELGSEDKFCDRCGRECRGA